MNRTITTLDNSKYKKDYNKYFTIGDDYGGSHEIGNTELSDKILTNIFNIINTIVVILPNAKGRTDGSLSHKIRVESGDSYTKIKKLLKTEKLKFHSKELHKLDRADCDSAIHFFEFKDYLEMINFLDWEELDKEIELKAYTTLAAPKPLVHSFSETKKQDAQKLGLSTIKLPTYGLTDYERVYLNEIYFRFLKEKDHNIKPYAFTASLWKEIPNDFEPEKIDSNLLKGGVMITPLGIYHIDPNSAILRYIDSVLGIIKELIHKFEGLTEVPSKEIKSRIPDISPVNLRLTLQQIHRMGSFTTGYSSNFDEITLKIDSDLCYKNILAYKSLEDFYKEKIHNLKGKSIIKDIRENLEVEGLVVNDGTEWFEGARIALKNNGLVVLWWNKLPSGINEIDTLVRLRERVNNFGFFEIHYCTQKKSYYKARVVNFMVRENYDLKELRKQYPKLPLLAFDDYIDNRTSTTKTAKIVFIANSLEKVEPRIPIEKFEFPINISPPTRNNLQPYLSINKVVVENNDGDESKTRILNIDVASPFTISEDVVGVIGVEDQAKELSDLIIALKPETGMMVGIFGRWGRGKTFFWKHMKDYIGKKKEKPFLFAEFHAWKYQDTPASWAYLYETISDVLIGDNSSSGSFLGVNKKVLKLNLLKKGAKHISFLLIAIFASIIVMIIPFEAKLSFVKYVFTIVPLSFLVSAYLIYRKHILNARQLFKEYSSLPSFKDLLGFQSEIQEELRFLLNASFPTDNDELNFKGSFSKCLFNWLGENNHKRLLLFVDDIDRCKEGRIVEIIGSLKVMLEDEIISKKIVVLTAVDERVLKRAIMHKYHDSILRTFEEDCKKNKETSESLSREYMDKLFISGIKLSALTDSEKNEIFDAYTKNKDKVNIKTTEDVDDGFRTYINDSKRVTEYYEELIPTIPASPIPFKRDSIPEKSRPQGAIDIRSGDSKFEIEEFEYEFLVKCLQNLEDATPRSIRIYYYRYLLAKKFRNLKVGPNTVNGFVWNMYPKKEILAHLLIYYGKTMSPTDLHEDRKNWIKNDSEDVTIKLFDVSYEINRLLLIDLLSIVEMVVPY